MPGPALNGLGVARGCFLDPLGGLPRGLLTSAFALVVGLERACHLGEMAGRGLAVLTGGRRCPGRYAVGGWRRHLPWYEVEAFCRRTSPWQWIRGEAALLSYDGHASPRRTHKSHIAKGDVTTRDKSTRCDKLCYTSDVLNGRYLAVRATPGDWGRNDLAVPRRRPALPQGRPDYVPALFDAAAGPADAAGRTSWDFVAQEPPRRDVARRACRHPHRGRLWQALPAEQFTAYQEPGPYVEAAAKGIRLAETTAVLKGEAAEQAVRAVTCREVVRGPKKGRRHPLFTTSLLGQDFVLGLFRLRQRHEQGYRVGVQDECSDAVPCGYAKESPAPGRPRWQRRPLPLLGWLVALVSNAAADGARSLAGDWGGCQVRTSRRAFRDRPGTLYQTPEALMVPLGRFGCQEAVEPAVDAFNAQGHRLPWLENRPGMVSLTPRARSRADP